MEIFTDLLVKATIITIFGLLLMIGMLIIGAVVDLLIRLWEKIFPDKTKTEVEKVYIYVPIPENEYEFTDLEYEFEHWNDD